MTLKEEIELMNEIIKAAEYDGGDPGGPYFSCPDYLIEVLSIWIDLKHYEGKVSICVDDFTHLVKLKLKEN